MMNEYYNPGFPELMDSERPEAPDPNGCLWQLIVTAVLVLLMVIYKK